jgi:hypothetical protein
MASNSWHQVASKLQDVKVTNAIEKPLSMPSQTVISLMLEIENQ